MGLVDFAPGPPIHGRRRQAFLRQRPGRFGGNPAACSCNRQEAHLNLAAMTRRSPLLALALLLVACGAKKPPTPDVPPPPAPPELPSMDAGALGADAGGMTAANDGGATTDTPPPPPKYTSKKITQKQDPAWAACHSTFQIKTKDVLAEVQKSGKGCTDTTKMKPVGPPTKATQADKNPPQQIKLKAQAGKCYRVYAIADAAIKDLDLLVKDSAGEVGAEDSTDDPSPVLLEDGAFCFKEADNAVIVVSVGEGKGTYAVQIWSD